MDGQEADHVTSQGFLEHPVFGKSQGVELADRMRERFGRELVMVQGVRYPAGLTGNFHEDRASNEATETAMRLILEINRDCPHTRIVFAGYSQGAALVATTLMSLAAQNIGNVTAAVMFGSTRHKQDQSIIPNFNVGKVLAYANPNDAITQASLFTTPYAHFRYFKYIDTSLIELTKMLTESFSEENNAKYTTLDPTRFEDWPHQGPVSIPPYTSVLTHFVTYSVFKTVTRYKIEPPDPWMPGSYDSKPPPPQVWTVTGVGQMYPPPHYHPPPSERQQHYQEGSQAEWPPNRNNGPGRIHPRQIPRPVPRAVVLKPTGI